MKLKLGDNQKDPSNRYLSTNLFVEVPHGSFNPGDEAPDAKLMHEDFDPILIADGETESVCCRGRRRRRSVGSDRVRVESVGTEEARRAVHRIHVAVHQ